MLSRAFRCQVRLQLADVDRGVYVSRQIALAQQPDEPDEHVLLRFLCFVFFYDEGIADGDGWSLLAEPDILIRDLTGELTTWIEVGAPSQIKRLVRALGRNKSGRTIAIFGDRDEALALRKELRSHRARNIEQLELILVSPELLQGLERVGSRSMAWSATISDGALFLDCDGEILEGGIERIAMEDA